MSPYKEDHSMWESALGPPISGNPDMCIGLWYIRSCRISVINSSSKASEGEGEAYKRCD